ncbi:molybdate ABC transporter substrate-binding protein [Clostridium thailandense]|uniref:Molybdate ABC transporter substrate-binding protein n=1 Tax=Clostridium thailandense TaxID=2794346 RepID=A0A949TYN9_9CLOT|nr:molybdate ABC transporter substrate-binding protein [Clostridium thailandense]MBV7272954.1 molybdate ABC transporter substrate-binding protein [Clostridium thailandense]MCH5136235.1 molybdate ABC transporter substrate-binding protein [Clostridiaceae bacterium UIB06]
MKKILISALAVFTLFSFTSCGQKPAENTKTTEKNITISAAASLKDALTEIKSKYEQKNGTKLTYNFASSGTLQKQIEQGASVDVFISAGAKQMNDLVSKNLIDKDTKNDLLKNQLVLIVSNDSKDKIKTINDVLNNNVKIAVGEPASVPAGQYAKDSLTKLNIWDKINPKIVYGKDVTQVATYVEKGEAAAGIVYKSDTVNLKNCFIAQTFDESLHSPIVYPEAVLSSSKNKEEAKKFLEYLNSDEAKDIFKKYSFEPNH